MCDILAFCGQAHFLSGHFSKGQIYFPLNVWWGVFAIPRIWTHCNLGIEYPCLTDLLDEGTGGQKARRKAPPQCGEI